jgi:hypothetical protein
VAQQCRQYDEMIAAEGGIDLQVHAGGGRACSGRCRPLLASAAPATTTTTPSSSPEPLAALPAPLHHCPHHARLTACTPANRQILGIGQTGHIGFNEPGAAEDSATRLVPLSRVTRADAASSFFGEAAVPRCAAPGRQQAAGGPGEAGPLACWPAGSELLPACWAAASC